MIDAGKIKLYLKAAVKSIKPETAIVKFGAEETEIPNDGVIVCAGGTLPTPFLKQIGVMVETKFGTA